MGMCDNHNLEEEIVRVTSENASKRHLPPWMRPNVAAATIPVRNSLSVEKNFTSETTEANAKAPDLTENAEIAVARHKRETTRRKSYSAQCKLVKRRRKLSDHDSRSDGNVTQKDKKKKDGSKVRSLRSSSKKSQIVEDPNCADIDANSVQGFGDDDIELTLEDLMTIAEEYVKDYEKKKQKEATDSQCESLKQFMKTGEYGNSLDPHCETQRSSTREREGLCSSTSNNAGELVPTRTSQAGDPAQEMLELLLGPLLKPLEKEKNKSVDSVEFTKELPGKKQVQISGEDKVPLTKRKCSLKDKVGLFLD